MEKTKLKYRFHNPNPDMVMEDYIQKIIISNGVKRIFTSLQNDIQESSREAEIFAETI